MEVIVKYVESLEEAGELFPGIQIVELFNGYAIVTLGEEELEAFSALPQVVFVELPKRVYYNLQAGRSVSCLSGVQKNPDSLAGMAGTAGRNLTGRGVLVGVVDSGIDLFHPAFIDEEGESRIAFFWDQSWEGGAASGEALGRTPRRYQRGREYSREEITGVINGQGEIGNTEGGRGHGTGVAGIAAGNGRGSRGSQYRGVATESELVVVKLGRENQDFAGTTDVMMGVDYCLRKALELGRPVAVNLSFGANQGAHNGKTLFEQYLSDLNGVGKNVIVAAAGNEGDTRHHAALLLDRGRETVEFAVGPGERRLWLQIWKQYIDQFRVTLTAPTGEQFYFPEEEGAVSFSYGDNVIYLFHGTPTPFQDSQELWVEWAPREGGTVEGGLWSLGFTPERILDGRVDLWLPTVEAIGLATGFLLPETAATLTIPATARNVITVGAYSSATDRVAEFSGRGDTVDGRQAPDLAAPGVGVVTARPGGGYGAQTGTSFAAPFVAGSAALLMEWGIVQGNDPYLYGEKLRVYLIKGARPLAGQREVPDNRAGYGALCVSASIPF